MIHKCSFTVIVSSLDEYLVQHPTSSCGSHLQQLEGQTTTPDKRGRGEQNEKKRVAVVKHPQYFY